MYSEHLANTNDSKSFFDIFYFGESLYLVHISTTQAFNVLKSQDQGHGRTSPPKCTTLRQVLATRVFQNVGNSHDACVSRDVTACEHAHAALMTSSTRNRKRLLLENRKRQWQ